MELIPGQVLLFFTLLVAGSVTSLLAVVAWRRRSHDGALSFALLMGALTLWTLGYAFELLALDLPGLWFWVRFQYLGIATFPLLWVHTALRFSGSFSRIPRVLYALLSVCTLLTLLLVISNDNHHLYYASIFVKEAGPFRILGFERGPAYWLYMAYAHSSVIWGNAIYYRLWRSAAPEVRSQAGNLLVGSLLPWAGNILYLLGQGPWSLDPTPLALTLSGTVFAWGLLRYRFLDLVPVARDQVFQSLPDGVVVLDRENRITDYNQRALALFPRLVDHRGLAATGAFSHWPEIRENLEGHCLGEQDIVLKREGITYYYLLRISQVDNRKKAPVGRVLFFHDVSSRKRLMDRLEEMATRDGLTGILNRRTFLEQSFRDLELAVRHQQNVSLIFLDIDHFKNINDSYGHQLGDQALVHLTRLIRGHLRDTDIFGRYGGEEFAVLLPHTPTLSALTLAQRLREILEENPFHYPDGDRPVTASFGVAGWSLGRAPDLNALIKAADDALYNAKMEGRNRVVLSPLFTDSS